jgi:hypothetical protein
MWAGGDKGMSWLLTAALSIVFVIFIAAAVLRRRFLRRIDELQRSLERAPLAAARTDLPPAVLALARRLGVSADGGGRLVRLTQSGEMWLKPGAAPLAFTARQMIAVSEVGFVWRAWFRVGGVPLHIIDYCVEDYCVEGQGGLEGRLLGAWPVVRMIGGEPMFRSEALRYLAELVWAPDALLFNPQLEWRVVDTRTLAVAVGRNERRCEVRLILDEAGDPVRAEADDRPRLEDRTVTLCRWVARASDYRLMRGRRIPAYGEVAWVLGGVEFIYWRGRVTSWSLGD